MENVSIIHNIVNNVYLMQDMSKWFESITTSKKYEMNEFVCCSFRKKVDYNLRQRLYVSKKSVLPLKGCNFVILIDV